MNVKLNRGWVNRDDSVMNSDEKGDGLGLDKWSNAVRDGVTDRVSGLYL